MRRHDEDCHLCSRNFRHNTKPPRDRFWIELWYLLFAASALVWLVWALAGRTL